MFDLKSGPVSKEVADERLVLVAENRHRAKKAIYVALITGDHLTSLVKLSGQERQLTILPILGIIGGLCVLGLVSS